MKAKGLTEILLIVDESGSMASLKNDTIGNLNKFISEQKAIEGMARITIAKFDSGFNQLRLKNIRDWIDIKDCQEVVVSEYDPLGGTPLFDAVFESIAELTKKNENLKKTSKGMLTKQASRYVVAIITDGEENSSKKYNKEDISKLIKQKEEEGWNFVYLSANADAFINATNLGINVNSLSNVARNYDPTSKGLETAYCSISVAVENVRTGKI